MWQPNTGDWGKEDGKSLRAKGKIRHINGDIFNGDKRNKKDNAEINLLYLI